MRRLAFFPTTTICTTLVRHYEDCYHASFWNKRLFPTPPHAPLTEEKARLAAVNLADSHVALLDNEKALKFLAQQEAELMTQRRRMMTERRSLLTTHAKAFDSVFHEMTEQWLTLGKALEEEKDLYRQFEALHAILDNLLTQKELDKARVKTILERIMKFTGPIKHPSATNCTRFARLAKENISPYTPQKSEGTTSHHVDVKVIHNPQRP